MNLKSLRKVTVKKRLPHDPSALDQLTDPAMQFAEQSHLGHYGRGLNAPYLPVMQVQHERMTLVARAGGERMTIDRNLQFWNAGNEAASSPETVVVETKSAFGRGIADTALRSNGYHRVGSCSKYCIGLAALGIVPRFNKFLPAFRRLLPHITSTQSAENPAFLAA
nr:VTC domain-containing protein [Roseobacter litoralis]